jgi:lipid-binding SYLF domain-containing protein
MLTQSLTGKLATLTASLMLSCAIVTSATAGERQDGRLLTSTQVLSELMAMPEQNIPTWLLERAYAVAVIPTVIKVGLGIGGRRGKGVLVVRKDNGTWSNPIFVNLTGGSFGFQVGGKVTLGADASVAAGPIGRQSSAATDIGLTAQVYSYSRASGLFAGVALDGSAITIDSASNEAFYKKPGILASEIIRSDAPSAPAPADQFTAAVQKAATGGVPTVSKAPVPAAEQPAPPASSTNSGSQPSGAQTYPMEDPEPGQEPPQ